METATQVLRDSRRPGRSSTAAQVLQGLDLQGRTYLVTGAASGLGFETARALAGRGAHVVVVARDIAQARDACRSLREATPLACDLSEPASILAAIRTLREGGVALDGIVANAGVMAVPRRTVKHGVELQFLVNHVGHHWLVTRLLDLLRSEARVVMVSSSLHRRAPPEGVRLDDLAAERGYRPWMAYGQSKMANLLFARELSTRLAPGCTANGVFPGVVATGLQRHLGPIPRAVFRIARPLFFKTLEQGAATQCYVAAHPQAAGITGAYFADCRPARPDPRALDAALARRLWERTETLIADLQARA